jgi:hypothetical protein
VAIVCGLVFMARVPPLSFAPMAVLVGIGAASFSTLAWMRQHATDFQNEGVEHQSPNWHEVNCRKATGAHLGEDPELVYFDVGVYGGYLGCHPTHAAGVLDTEWGIKIFPTLEVEKQLLQLDSDMVPKDKDLVAICPAAKPGDAICRQAEERGLCKPQGRELFRCTLSPDFRRGILGDKK